MTSDEAIKFLGYRQESAEMLDDIEDFGKVIDLIEQQAATIARLSAPLTDAEWDAWCSMRHAIDNFLQERLNG